MDRFDPFVKYADVYGDVINWEKDPMNKPQNQNKYFFSDGKTYYEQICKMLRLMSVFKQAFNQIYDNEDEIHSAWENFVDNLSATAVYGEEVGVNLTWTDTSVNFAFTIPGGQDGVGIQSITFNSDYTMTITLTDGSTYTSESLRGAQGEQGIQGLQGPAGPQGEPGSGLEILDVYATLQDLQTAHPTGSPGDAYQVGTAPSFTLYIWSASQSAWVSAGTIGSAVPSSADPLMDGTASAGISDLYARGDHVHPTDTSRASAQDLQTVDDKVDAVDDRVDDISDIINTSQKLIDQSFVYRESPAEHDGLAVLDKIKGHTVKFNQVIQNGDFESTDNWLNAFADLSISGNKLIATASGSSLQIYQSSTNRYKSGEKFYIACGVKASVSVDVRLRISRHSPVSLHNYVEFPVTANIHTRAKAIITLANDLENTRFGFFVPDSASGDTFELDNFICINLTSIFGSGNEPSTVSDFETWLSNNIGLLPYYDYTLGSLISFNGTGLKTTGKNLFNKQDTTIQSDGVTYDLNDDGSYTISGTPTGYSFVNSYCNVNNSMGVITISGFDNATNMCCDVIRLYDSSNTMLFETGINSTSPITIDLSSYPTVTRMAVGIKRISNNVAVSGKIYFQMEFGNQATAYEPYTENTLSLPISTLFPTGMKSVPDANSGTIYDELSSSRADTRVRSVDLGTLNWRSEIETYIPDGQCFLLQPVPTDLNIKMASSNNVAINGESAIYKIVPQNELAGESAITGDMRLAVGTGVIRIVNKQYTTEEAFKQAMSGVMLYYELATPIEQDIDLDLSFKAYEGGTEQLLPVNGSTPTTSSLLADMTYFSINDAMDYILAKLDQDVSSITSDITSLKTRMTSAEGNITSLGDRMTTAEGNITSLTGRMTTAEGNISSNASRISELETDLLKIEVKQFDYATVAAGSSVGTTTTITVEEGYTAIGVVGTEIQAGEFTSPLFNSAITQCHIEYTSSNNLRIIIGGRNNSAVDVTNVRLYAYILCMKDIQSE